MRGVVTATVVLICSFVGSQASGQELSNELFPSEDELIIAYEAGEISFEQLIVLIELATLGVDSSSTYLVDEIPNVSFWTDSTVGTESYLEMAQRAGFERSTRLRRNRLVYSYTERTEEPGGDRRRWRFGGVLQPLDRTSVDFAMHREFSGRERFVRRSVTFRPEASSIRRIIVGNYTARLGLGTIFGYRGKLLTFSGTLNSESLLFPDYGGFNGLLVNSSTVDWESTTLLSFNRDVDHRLLSIGTGWFRLLGRNRIGFILGGSRLSDRRSGHLHHDLKVALSGRYRHDNGYVAAELTGQGADSPSAAALVVEGQQRAGETELRVAVWRYTRGFFDLTGGSKSAQLTRRGRIDDVDFDYSTRRDEQSGVLLRTSVAPTQRMELRNSLLYGRLGLGNDRLQYSSEISLRVNADVRAGVRYLGKFRTRTTASFVDRDSRSEYRVFVSLRRKTVSGRWYLSRISEKERQSHWSLFGQLRLQVDEAVQLELWSNLTRLGGDRPVRWYPYARMLMETGDFFSLAIKLSQRQVDSSVNRSRPQVSLEITGTW